MNKNKSINLLKSQPAGVWYLIALSMWEYFSYYGMRALLILYLSNALLFSDRHAYALYGAYTALVYVTPLLGGIIADRFLGYRNAVICGALLMVAGHIILGTTQGFLLLYVALAFIVCGYGLFKSNISCVLGRLYRNKDPRRESGFALMYVGGNIGAFLAPLACAFVASRWGWHFGFGLAGLGMAIGLVIYYFGRRHFAHLEKPVSSLFSQQGWITAKGITWILGGVVIAVAIIATILFKLWAGWLLLAAAIVMIIFFVRLIMRCNSRERKAMITILVIMLFSLIFWSFDQQGGSSISLFIERNVIRHFGSFTIPTADFQSINPAAILIGGLFVAWLWRTLHKRNIHIAPLFKIATGMLILTAGFFFIALSARIAIVTGHVSMLGVVVGMLLTGFGELFIDPIALAEITRLNPAQSVGFLAGVYMMVTGSFANYLAAKIATFTSIKESAQHTVNLSMAAQHYYATFHMISLIALLATIVLITTALVLKLLLN